MPILVEVPGYGDVEFPDGMSDDQISAAIQKNMAPPQVGTSGGPPTRNSPRNVPSFADKALDLGKDAASAIVRPVAQAIAAPGNAAVDFVQGMAYLGKKGLHALKPKQLSDLIVDRGPQMPNWQSQAFNQALDHYTRAPATKAGRVTETINSMIVGGMLPAPRVPAGAPPNFRPPAASPRDSVFAAGRDIGMVAPPASVAPTMGNRMLETLGGKVATAQDASLANMPRFTDIAKRAAGIADDQQLSPESLDAVRRGAGKAYADVAGLGKLPAVADDVPRSVAPRTTLDPLALTQRTEVDAAAMVEAWKQSNHDATAYYRAFARDANPETLAKAKASAADAKKIDAFLDKTLDKLGRTDLLQALRDARVQIAKTHSVEGALNPATGQVSGTKLAQQLAKGKPLSGDLKTAAQFAQAFPKASREILDSGSVRNTDLIVGGGTAAITGQPWYLGYPMLRNAARATLLSDPMQNGMVPSGTRAFDPRWLGATAPAIGSLFD